MYIILMKSEIPMTTRMSILFSFGALLSVKFVNSKYISFFADFLDANLNST